MNLLLITPGKIKQPYFNDAENDYTKRIKRFGGFEIIEVKEEKISNKKPVDELKTKEALRIKEKIPQGAIIIALSETGKQFTAHEFAAFFQKQVEQSRPIVFLIGGANGLLGELMQMADHKLSLGRITLTQDLARINLLEAMFRALSINNNLPFHR
jgi:23S rRNA (pseudouridine1915-N3)-methyltransferase